MDLDKETQEKIQILQSSEQTLQGLLKQKQAFSIELSEVENALTEITKSGDDVYKLIGQIMIKSDKDKIAEELKKRQELLSVRLKSIENQETDLTTNLEKIREEVMKKIK